MRYAQVGGLTAERRRFRERIRYEAGERFTHGQRTAVIAKELRVSKRSLERRRRAWREGGMTSAALGAYIVLEGEAGFTMTPPRAPP
ncbi:hypothetical protein GCM10010339_91380 [Streptomyces alanosinicus]|uniref:Uncharacterized protein n=1 Tax=Streptomyces alanosinicus TaxID=68171 RepID=A0A918YTQ6_9ACTN|nr:hypothetical protein GCM10010339_91380 [Streptomyces alanosinicus]